MRYFQRRHRRGQQPAARAIRMIANGAILLLRQSTAGRSSHLGNWIASIYKTIFRKRLKDLLAIDQRLRDNAGLQAFLRTAMPAKKSTAPPCPDSCPDPCPCGQPKSYADCCGRWHAGAAAPTAEALMRSRYSAFVLALEPYLRSTWHASTRPADVQADENTRWLGLTIKRFEATGADSAIVEFVARYKIGGRAQRLHEVSRFVREDGRWYYINGDLDGDLDGDGKVHDAVAGQR
jgi:SEC-C motif-containing protein